MPCLFAICLLMLYVYGDGEILLSVSAWLVTSTPTHRDQIKPSHYLLPSTSYFSQRSSAIKATGA
jgi:hypothetical protein